MIKTFLRFFFIFVIGLGSEFYAFGQPNRTVKNQYVDVDGAQLFVQLVGSGKSLVMVHGGPGMSHDYLAPQFIDLLHKDFQLIFYDQRASGRSTGVEDTTRLTISQFVDDLEILRQQLKIERLNLIGHSFGGLLAMYYAISYPENVGKLLLLDSSPASWELNFPYFRKVIAERQTRQDKLELSAIESQDGFGTDPGLMDRYFKIYFKTFFKNPSLSQNLILGIDENWLSNSRITGNFIWKDLDNYDIHDKLINITAATLIMHGEESVISIEGAEAINRYIPNSELIILKDVGHFPYVEAPNNFSQIVKEFFGR